MISMYRKQQGWLGACGQALRQVTFVDILAAPMHQGCYGGEFGWARQAPRISLGERFMSQVCLHL